MPWFTSVKGLEAIGIIVGSREACREVLEIVYSLRDAKLPQGLISATLRAESDVAANSAGSTYEARQTPGCPTVVPVLPVSVAHGTARGASGSGNAGAQE